MNYNARPLADSQDQTLVTDTSAPTVAEKIRALRLEELLAVAGGPGIENGTDN